MSYVYMKSLENRAQKYDEGINLLTLGKYSNIQRFVSNYYLNKGEALLDLGVGTGTFAILAAQKGVKVTGVDSSDKMLAMARKKIKKANLDNSIELMEIPIINLELYFQENSFDKVTAMLTFSELYEKEQDYCLEQIHRVLKEGGELIIIDEVLPKKFWKRALYYLIRFPTAIITYLLSRLSTKPLKDLERKLDAHHFNIVETKLFLLDTLTLYKIKKSAKETPEVKK